MDSKEATTQLSDNGILLKTDELSSDSLKGNKVIVFSDDEGGYLSGKEEFEPSSDKPVLGEEFEPGSDKPEGNSDDPFVEASEKVGSSSVGVDDDDEKVSDGVVLLGENTNSGLAFVGKESSSEELKVSSEKGVEGIGGENVEKEVKEGEVREKIESLSGEALADEKEEKGVGVPKSAVSEPAGVKLTSEGDSVVDAVNVDVSPAEPSVAVVADPKQGVKEVDVPVVNEVEGKGVDASEPAAPEPAEAEPGVAVVETGLETEAVEDPAATEAEQKLVDGSAEQAALEASEKFTPEGDAVVDTISVDVRVAEPGVAVVGETGLETEVVEVPVTNGAEEKVAGVPVPAAVDPAGEKLTSEGDSVVNSINVNVRAAEPGVAVVGETNSEVKGVDRDVKLTDEIGHGLEEQAEPATGNTDVSAIHDSIDKDIASDNGLNKTDRAVYKVDADNDAEAVTEGKELDNSVADETSYINGDHVDRADGLEDGVAAKPNPVLDIEEITRAGNEEVGSESDGEETDDMIFGGSDAAKKFIEELERGSTEQSNRIDGQIVTDSEEEAETDEEGDGKELFDSAALAALLKAATGGESDAGNITITSQDGSRLFSVERPAGLGSSLRSLRPGPQPIRPSIFSPFPNSVEPVVNLSDEERNKLEKLQQIRVKFLRLVHRLGLSPEESLAAQVLYRISLLAGRQNNSIFNLDDAKVEALQLESQGRDDLDFSLNILVLGKSGVGKSATINSLFGEEKAPIGAFEIGTTSINEINGSVDGVKIKVFDTPGLKSSDLEQALNRSILSSVMKLTKKTPPDVVLYVDRLDTQTRDLNDLPLMKTITTSLGSSIWRSVVVTLTHAGSAPPDGPTGNPLSHDVFVNQRTHVVQQAIGRAVGDIRMMSPGLMNPHSLVENHPSCRKNRDGQKILPNGQSWRPQLLLLCYSMKILSEAGLLAKPQDPFDHRKLFGFRVRSPPLAYMLSTTLQSRPHPKLTTNQGGEEGDSDIELDDFSDSDKEEEDEYDQLPPFKPLRKAQISKLSNEQRKAYFEEYDYRVKLLQKKQFKEEIRRLKETKKKGGKDGIAAAEYDEDQDSGAAAPVAIPLPDMALPHSFDSDNPAYRYRFLEPTSSFLARPVLDTHGWDHDCGYDGVNLEHNLPIFNRFPASYTVQISKDKKDFTITVDSAIAVKHNEGMSTMAGFDVQNIGKQLAYIIRADTKFKKFKKNKASGGITVTFLGENMVPGLKFEDQITIGKRYTLGGSVGAVRANQEMAYGANLELQRKELDYPIGQVQSQLSLSVIKWRGDLALGLNGLTQFNIGRGSKVAVRAGLNNKMSGQFTVRTSSTEHLSLVLAAIVPAAISVYKKLFPGAAENYGVY